MTSKKKFYMDDMKGVLGDDKFEILHAFNHYFIVWDIFSIELKTEAVSYLLQDKNPFLYIKEKMQGELDAKGEHDYKLDHEAFKLYFMKKPMKFEKLMGELHELDPIANKTQRQEHEWTAINEINRILDELYSFEDGHRNFRRSGSLEHLVNQLKESLSFLKGSMRAFRELEREGR